jgi:hypothetical protein
LEWGIEGKGERRREQISKLFSKEKGQDTASRVFWIILEF